MTEAYPLSWPQGWPRAKSRERSRFRQTFGSARDELFAELRRMGARKTILSTNIPLRNDGLPYATFARPQDSGAAVYFEYRNKSMVFACDRWESVTENVYAVAQTIGALRGIERWGASDMIERAFTGFTALPAPSSKKKLQWFHVLDCEPDAGLDDIEISYRLYAKQAHPDAGGSNEEMAKLNWAIEEARKIHRA